MRFSSRTLGGCPGWRRTALLAMWHCQERLPLGGSPWGDYRVPRDRKNSAGRALSRLLDEEFIYSSARENLSRLLDGHTDLQAPSEIGFCHIRLSSND